MIVHWSTPPAPWSRTSSARLLGAEQGAGVEAEADLALVRGARRRPDDFQIEGVKNSKASGRTEIEVGSS